MSQDSRVSTQIRSPTLVGKIQVSDCFHKLPLEQCISKKWSAEQESFAATRGECGSNSAPHQPTERASFFDIAQEERVNERAIVTLSLGIEHEKDAEDDHQK